MTQDEARAFQHTILDYFDTQGRHELPWRLPEADGSYNPYKIMVSEIMLQQTQVQRVIPKFFLFLERFPTVQALAKASLADVLQLWSGLGYNRRAKFLLQAAQAIVQQHDGQVPRTREALVALPGIGTHTAGAILAYAFDERLVFIETNVRTVFIHHFFADKEKVSDIELVPIIEQTLPQQHAREWYWAIMDYGTHLKQTVGNASRLSASYAKQSMFQGSQRQIRGKVLRLLQGGPLPLVKLVAAVEDERLESVLESLTREGLIEPRAGRYQLSS